MVKNPPANAGDTGNVVLILGSGRSPGGGNGNPLQYSCLENPMDEEPGGYSPWGHKESDTTERPTLPHFSLNKHSCLYSELTSFNRETSHTV